MRGNDPHPVPPEPASSSEHERRFTELYEQYFDFVWRSVRMFGVNTDAADDVVQDVFLVAHRRLDDFEARASARTWLFAITRRVVSAQRRSLRRRFRLFLRVKGVATETVATPFEITADGESQRALIAALEALPEEQRVIFVLTELEELTAPEIASTLGLNVNTVYSRLRVARRTLAAKLTTKEAEVAT